MNLATVFTLIALALAAALAALIGLRWWMSQPERVLAEIDALDLPADTKAAIRANCAAAQKADQRTWFYDLSAPLVMLLVLPFVPRSADRLPRLFSKWDNNVSLNGDGEVVRRGDRWVNLRDIGWTPEPGERVYRYDDPEYDGTAYYMPGWLNWLPAKWRHPRSFWARWVWVGWRNRASKLSLDIGEQVDSRPTVVDAEPDYPGNASRTREGHYLLRQGDLYQFRQFFNLGPLAVYRNVGFKLEHVMYSPSGTGLASAVAIGWAFKLRK